MPAVAARRDPEARGQSPGRLAALPSRPAGSSPSVVKIIPVCLADGVGRGDAAGSECTPPIPRPGLCTLLLGCHSIAKAVDRRVGPRDPPKLGFIPASPSCIPLRSGGGRTL